MPRSADAACGQLMRVPSRLVLCRLLGALRYRRWSLTLAKRCTLGRVDEELVENPLYCPQDICGARNGRDSELFDVVYVTLDVTH